MSTPNEYSFEEFISTFSSAWLKEYCLKFYGSEGSPKDGEFDGKFIKELLKNPGLEDKHTRFRLDVFDIFCVGGATDQLMLNANRLIIYKNSLARKIFKTSDLSEEEKKAATKELNDLEDLLSGTNSPMEFSREIFLKRPGDFRAIWAEFLLSKNQWESREFEISRKSINIFPENINVFKDKIDNNREKNNDRGSIHISYFLHHQKGHLLLLRHPDNRDYESMEIMACKDNGDAHGVLKIMAPENRREHLLAAFNACFCG